MDLLTALKPESDYSMPQLQLIVSAWVASSLFDGKKQMTTDTGHVEEESYTKQSIYSLFYSLYRSVGVVKSDSGAPYEFTFNTWGYDWPESWGAARNGDDAQRFGINAYAGLFNFEALQEYVAQREGRVHVVEMGCGTGAGANYVCSKVLPECTYEAIDMQAAGVKTCQRKFVPHLGGRLKATRADATKMAMDDGVADIVAVCETHVTEVPGKATDEDLRFFREAVRILKPGGFLVWGNAIPDSTWQPCFDILETLGMKPVEVRDVTKEAIAARDKDRDRVDAYVEQATRKFAAFRIPVIGPKRRGEAALAMKNFYRNPGTSLYGDLASGFDTYKVVAMQKSAPLASG